MSSSLYYQASGRAPLSGVVKALLFGLGAAVVGSYVYSMAVYHIPIIYLNLLVCLAFGYIIGMAVAAGGKSGSLRNKPAFLLVGLICGIAGALVQWPMYLGIVSSEGAFFDFSKISYFLSNPQIVLPTVEEINRYGLWSIKNAEVNGTELWAVWGLEFAVITCTAVYYAMTHAKTPYSETGNCWMNTEDLDPALSYVEDPKALLSSIASGDYSQVYNIGPSEDPAKYSKLSWFFCPEDQFAYLTLTNTEVVTKKKKSEEKSKLVFDKLQVPFSQAVQLTDKIRSFVPKDLAVEKA